MNNNFKENFESYWNNRKFNFSNAETKRNEWANLKKEIGSMFDEVGVLFFEKSENCDNIKKVGIKAPINVTYSNPLNCDENGLNFVMLQIPSLEVMSYTFKLKHYENESEKDEYKTVTIEEVGGLLCISQNIKGEVIIVVSAPYAKQKNNDFKYCEGEALILKVFSSPFEVKNQDIKKAIEFMFQYSLVTSFSYSKPIFSRICLFDKETRFIWRLILWDKPKSWFYSKRDYILIISYVLRSMAVVHSK